MFSELTFKALKESVIESMERNNQSVIVLGNEPRATDTDTILNHADSALKDFITIFNILIDDQRVDPNTLKKGRILVGYSHYWLRINQEFYDKLKSNLGKGYPLSEWLFDFGILGAHKNGVPSGFFQKRGVTFHKILSSFVDPHIGAEAFTGVEFSRYLKYSSKPVSLERFAYLVSQFFIGGDKKYLYLTDTMIDKHYRVLNQTQNCSSCMSKPPEFYEHLRPDHYQFTGQARYIHPLEAYENSPNVRLGLIADKPMTEWADDEYPFKTRVLLTVDLEGKPYGSTFRFYGKELTSGKKLLMDAGFENDFRGAILTAIYDYDGVLCQPYVDNLDYDHSNKVLWLDHCCDEEGQYANVIPPEYWGSTKHYVCCSRSYSSFGANSADYFAVEPTETSYTVGRPYTNIEEAYRINGMPDDVDPYENKVYVEYLDDYVDEEDVVYSSYAEGYILLEDAVDLEGDFYHRDLEGEVFGRCAYTNNFYLMEDLVYSEYHEDWYNTDLVDSELIYSSELEDYFLEEYADDFYESHNWVKVYGDHYSNNYDERYAPEDEAVFSEYYDFHLLKEIAVPVVSGTLENRQVDYIHQSQVASFLSHMDAKGTKFVAVDSQFLEDAYGVGQDSYLVEETLCYMHPTLGAVYKYGDQDLLEEEIQDRGYEGSVETFIAECQEPHSESQVA